jgi:hypothetical protein
LSQNGFPPICRVFGFPQPVWEHTAFAAGAAGFFAAFAADAAVAGFFAGCAFFAVG